MIDLLYNGIFLCLAVLWVSGRTPILSKRMIGYAKRHAKAFLVVLWVLFLVFAAAYCLFFNQLAGMHDIPNAVDSAVDSQQEGLNPYNHSVIPRFDGQYSSTVSLTYGPYNYLPLDLYVYTVCENLLGVLGMPLWFVAANIMFSAAGFFLLNRILGSRWIHFIPLAGVVALFYSFDNVSLTLLLVLTSISLYYSRNSNLRILSVILMGLAVMTKIQAVIPFAVLVMFELQQFLKSRDRQMFLKTSASVAASGGIGAALLLPFGIWNVIKAAVLFHADAVTRAGTSSGGTLLMELSLPPLTYSALVLAIVMGALVAALRFRGLSDRMMLVSMVFLLVAVKSSQALLVVPGIFLALGFFGPAGGELKSSAADVSLSRRHADCRR
jgi:hypothetical protein